MSKRARTMADSMAQAASMLGCSVADLKRAKSAGCDGFRCSRVDLEKVKAWLGKQVAEPEAEQSKAQLECRRLLAQCKKLEFALSVEEGNHVPIEDVKRDAISAGNAIRGIINQLVNDIASWAGLDSAALHAKACAWRDEMFKRLNSISQYQT